MNMSSVTPLDLAKRPMTTMTRTAMKKPMRIAMFWWLAAVRLVVDPDDLGLAATEFEFADGSTMVNAFSNTESNPELPPGTFEMAVDPAAVGDDGTRPVTLGNVYKVVAQ